MKKLYKGREGPSPGGLGAEPTEQNGVSWGGDSPAEDLGGTSSDTVDKEEDGAPPVVSHPSLNQIVVAGSLNRRVMRRTAVRNQ